MKHACLQEVHSWDDKTSQHADTYNRIEWAISKWCDRVRKRECPTFGTLYTENDVICVLWVAQYCRTSGKCSLHAIANQLVMGTVTNSEPVFSEDAVRDDQYLPLTWEERGVLSMPNSVQYVSWKHEVREISGRGLEKIWNEELILIDGWGWRNAYAESTACANIQKNKRQCNILRIASSPRMNKEHSIWEQSVRNTFRTGGCRLIVKTLEASRMWSYIFSPVLSWWIFTL